MIYAVWLPLLMPFLAVPVARRGAGQLSPRSAAWALTALALILALAGTASLALLALAGALHLPFVARIGHLSPRLLGDGSPATVPAAVLAAVALAGLGALALGRTRRHLLELRAAQRQLRGRRAPATSACGRTTGPTRTPCPGGRATSW